MTIALSLPVPVRASLTDDPAEILRFVVDGFQRGGVALATLVTIRGGAARPLGSHVAVTEDGRFCGFVSGGCVEAAIAAEALLALQEGRDRCIKLGLGSPYIDLVLPCGGGITVAIHVVRNSEPIVSALRHLVERSAAAIAYSPELQALEFTDPLERAGWWNGRFVSVYRPETRLLVSGAGAEAVAVSRLAEASRWEVCLANTPHPDTDIADRIDEFTAVVTLHHDLDAELSTLLAALASPAYYIGALGSTRTHRRRSEALLQKGISKDDIARIRAPIGIFGPARDSTSLALSIVADIAAARLATFA